MIVSQSFQPRLVEPGYARFAFDELRLEIERLRAFVEIRAHAQENMMRAMAAESVSRAAETLESRIQLASREAMAFAGQGLEQHEAALRALGRRVAELGREEHALFEPREIAAPAVAGHYVIGVCGAEGATHQPLDIRRDSEHAFLSDLGNLPILPGGAAQLVASHVVEFVPTATLIETILPHWRSRLARGGELVVITRDGPAWIASFSRGGEFDALRKKLGADGASQPVRNLFDAPGLCAVLRAAGFAPAEPSSEGAHAVRVVALAAAP